MKRKKVVPGLDWTDVQDAQPPEKALVSTRRKSAVGYSEPIELRRKGEDWFFPDWTQKIATLVPMQWKYVSA